MKQWSFAIWIALILAVLGLILIIISSFNPHYNDGSGVLDADLASKYGNFVGGVIGPIFSLAGFFLLYETIIAQRKSFESQQLETKFFELIRYHRDNVASMEHRVPGEDEKYVKGAAVFIEIHKQFNKMYKIIKPLVADESSIIEGDKEKTSINIVYTLLFNGVSMQSQMTVKEILKNYGEEFVQSIINSVYSKKAKYNERLVYYAGHQVRLGHYYRHLFQTVKFIDRSPFLTPKQKYEYVKTLRAQLTQYELSIFFINSLSIGEEWEKNNYITNYKFIKNLPPNFIAEINPKDYYDKFKYEWEKRLVVESLT